MLSGRLWVIFFFFPWCNTESQLCSRSSIRLSDALFNTWKGSLVQVSSTPCIHALMLQEGTQITLGHVSLLRFVCAEWISLLFCDLPFCWGSVRSLCAQPWHSNKNCSFLLCACKSEGVGDYNEIMKCSSFFFPKTDRWDAIFLDTTKRLPAVSSLSG